MTVQEISDKIYAFEGNAEEWLAFENDINKEIEKLSEVEVELLIETDAVEHLLMVCDGIRSEE